MLVLLIYLASLSDSLRTFVAFSTVIFMVPSIIMFLMFLDEQLEDWMKKYYLISLKWLMAICIAALIIPSSNSIYLMAGVHYAQKIPETEVYSEAMDILRLKLDRIKKELLEDK